MRSRFRVKRGWAAAFALAIAGLGAFASPALSGSPANVAHFRIDETEVDAELTFLCGFTVISRHQDVLTDVQVAKDGRYHEVFGGPTVATLTNPANGLSVVTRNVGGINTSYTAKGSSAVVVTLFHGLNYLIKTNQGVFKSAGSSAYGWRFTLDASGAATGVEALGHALTPSLYHAAPVLCVLLGAVDTDHDYLPDVQGVRSEAAFGTDPQNADTDLDGYLDGLEVANGTDPRSALSHPQNAIGNVDKDNDFLDDEGELLFYGTDPLNPDTDGDGYLDGLELLIYGTDPTDANSHP